MNVGGANVMSAVNVSPLQCDGYHRQVDVVMTIGQS